MTDTHRCERCGKELSDVFVFLELNAHTGRYATPGRVPPEESQGLFRFGKTCAHYALAFERQHDARMAGFGNVESGEPEPCECETCGAHGPGACGGLGTHSPVGADGEA